MKSLYIMCFLGVLISAGSVEVSKADQLLINGGFEDPPLVSGNWSITESIPGWHTVGYVSGTAGTGIEVQDNAAGAPHGGDNLVELDSWSNSTMEQFVSTISGEMYSLSFFYSGRPNVVAESNGIEVLWNGSVVVSLATAGQATTYWTEYVYNVTGTGTDSLRFRAIGTSEQYGGYLDDVSLIGKSPVPEPATLLLFGAGLVGLVGTRIRRKK